MSTWAPGVWSPVVWGPGVWQGDDETPPEPAAGGIMVSPRRLRERRDREEQAQLHAWHQGPYGLALLAMACYSPAGVVIEPELRL